MKRSVFIAALAAGFLCSQTPPAATTGTVPEALKPTTVIATVDGRKITYGEIEGYLNALGPERKASALASPRELIQQYAFQMKLVELAEKEKLDQVSPYKETLEVSRRALLTEAAINDKNLHLVVTAEDQKKFYEANKDRYNEVKLQEIYLPFTSDAVAKENPKKYRNEAQAKALALKIRAEAKTNADFVRLVKQYSEDEPSKARNGEYGTLKMSDANVPEEIKKAVFSLKQDQVSEPLKQQNGYYLFRAQSVGLRPYEDVRDEIYRELKDAGLKQWIAELQKNISISLDSPAFFNAPAPVK